MINQDNGNIKINDKPIINQNSDFDSINKMNLGEKQEVDNVGSDWISLEIKNLKTSGFYFNITFRFLKKYLKEVSLVLSEEKFDSKDNWSNWNEQEEREKIKFYQKWIEKEIGIETEFNWGNIWVGYDAKGGSSSICLRYK